MGSTSGDSGSPRPTTQVEASKTMPISMENPLLLVKKQGTNYYCLVQDLRAINEVIVTLYSALPNPYNLPRLIHSKAQWFTYLYFKDVFFCLQLAPPSQSLFTFEWENPTRGAKEHFTWTRLLQGFKKFSSFVMQGIDI